jgi:hypothetical protein
MKTIKGASKDITINGGLLMSTTRQIGEESFKSGVKFAQRWIPVEEELPTPLPYGKYGMIENKDLLLLKWARHDSFEFGVLRDSKGGKFWDLPDRNILELKEVTHWRKIELK